MQIAISVKGTFQCGFFSFVICATIPKPEKIMMTMYKPTCWWSTTPTSLGHIFPAFAKWIKDTLNTAIPAQNHTLNSQKAIVLLNVIAEDKSSWRCWKQKRKQKRKQNVCQKVGSKVDIERLSKLKILPLISTRKTRIDQADRMVPTMWCPGHCTVPYTPASAMLLKRKIPSPPSHTPLKR